MPDSGCLKRLLTSRVIVVISWKDVPSGALLLCLHEFLVDVDQDITVRHTAEI